MVISNNIQNEFDDQIIVAPLTTDEIEIIRSSFEVFIDKTSENGLENTSKILCNRLQTIDTTVRLKGFIGAAGPEIMSQVNRALKTVLVVE